MNNRKSWTFDELEVSTYETSKSVRGTFDRYSVLVDDQWYYPKTRKTLENLLSDIITDIKPRVFRNGGKGVTIDFDNVKKDVISFCR